MNSELARLQKITWGCRDDMHEPDEQGLKARVVGDHLDNAFGDHIDAKAIIGGFQELVVILSRNGRDECFNLANLINLARRSS